MNALPKSQILRFIEKAINGSVEILFFRHIIA